MPPLYKTIVMEMLQDRPSLYEQLRVRRTLLQSLEQLATALKSCHQGWMTQLAEVRPGSDPIQISSEALELALQELQESLPPASPPSGEDMEPLSLDEAMNFLNRHMPAG
ncbi:MAG TPA: hypothetical protein VMV10_01865 [Pirellulales bacterium]|nr:hypothetical protein [Pirellulales bacterium]